MYKYMKEMEKKRLKYENKTIKKIKKFCDYGFKNQEDIKRFKSILKFIFFNSFIANDNIYSFLKNNMDVILSKIKNPKDLSEIFYIILQNSTQDTIKELTEQIQNKEIIAKIIVGLIGFDSPEEDKIKYNELIENLITSKKIDLDLLIANNLETNIFEASEDKIILMNKLYKNISLRERKDILKYALALQNIELITKVINSSSKEELANLSEEIKIKILLYCFENKIPNELKAKIFNNLSKNQEVFQVNDEYKYLFARYFIPQELQGENQIIYKDNINFIYDKNTNSIILNTKSNYANMKNKKEHNIKLFDEGLDENKNKVMTYYKLGTNDVLATLIIDEKTGELKFDFTKGMYNDPNFQKYVNEVINSNFKDNSAFSYNLSYLALAPSQYSFYLNKQKATYIETKCKHTYEGKFDFKVENNINKAKILEKSMEEPDNVIVFNFDVTGHSTQAIVQNGHLVLINTGGATKKIYKSFIETVKYFCDLKIEEGIEEEKFKNLKNFVLNTEKTENKQKQKWEIIAKYMKDNNFPIAMTYTRDILQSSGNCVIASKIAMNKLICEHNLNFRNNCLIVQNLENVSRFCEEGFSINKFSEEDIKITNTILEANAKVYKENKSHFLCTLDKLEQFQKIINFELTTQEKNIKKLVERGLKKKKLTLITFLDDLEKNPNKYKKILNSLNKITKINENMNYKMQILLIYIKDGYKDYLNEYMGELNKIESKNGEKMNHLIALKKYFALLSKNENIPTNIYVKNKCNEEIKKLFVNNYEILSSKNLHKDLDFKKLLNEIK